LEIAPSDAISRYLSAIVIILEIRKVPTTLSIISNEWLRMAYVDNIRMFIRIFDLGSMSAGGRDQRVSPAVASSRIAELERHLGVRLFNRTTRSLQPTEHGKIFYDRAARILDAISDAEAAVADVTNNPRGSIFVAAPLGVGRRFIAPEIPIFRDKFPMIDVRLRLSDRIIDVTGEGLDVAFTLGELKDSNLRLRSVAECPRVLCAAPSYIERRGNPKDGRSLVDDAHECLLLRFPGATEFQWSLKTDHGRGRFAVTGPFEADDGDVLTAWALDGRGIINKPFFEVSEHLADGRLIAVSTNNPPVSVQLSCLYPHKRFQDPKSRLFIEHMVTHCREALTRISQARQATSSHDTSSNRTAKAKAARDSAKRNR
jgi:DNA-binding transcriptional LysR family regulator